MDDHRQLSGQGDFDLAAEKDLLLLFPTGVPVVVQSDLPDGDAARLPGHGLDLLQITLRHVRQILRVDTHRGADEGIACRQLQRSPAAGHAAARHQDQLHTVFRHGGKQRLPVGVEGLVIVMGMGVKIHTLPSSCRYLTLNTPVLQVSPPGLRA